MTIKIDGQLEIDSERGVIYFHNGSTGVTDLRICNLPIPIPDPRWIIRNGVVEKEGSPLDITHMYGASWSNQSSVKVEKIKRNVIDDYHEELTGERW
jgi:hypothetical protein